MDKLFIEEVLKKLSEKRFEKLPVIDISANLLDKLLDMKVKDFIELMTDLAFACNGNLVLIHGDYEIDAYAVRLARTYLDYEDRYVDILVDLHRKLAIYIDKLRKRLKIYRIMLNETLRNTLAPHGHTVLIDTAY